MPQRRSHRAGRHRRHNPPNRGWISDEVEPSISPTIDRLTDEDTKAYIRVAFSGMDAPYSADERYFTRVGTSNKQMAALSHGDDIEPMDGRTPCSRMVLESSSDTYWDPRMPF